MKLSRLFIARPKMATLLMLGLFIFGGIAYNTIPVSYLPSVKFPVIEVTASLSGASAETMASNVATPLEQQFSDIDGLESMSSVSNLGQTTIILVFDLERNIDVAAMDVQAAISRAGQNLPTLDVPPSYKKVNPLDQPVIWVTLTSDSLRMSKVYDCAKNILADSVSMIEGIGDVIIYGSSKYAVRIQLDPQKLAALQIGINEVSGAIENASVDLPLGSIKGPHTAPLIKDNGQLYCAAEYADIIVTTRNGQPVYLKDLGDVLDGIEEEDVKVRVMDKDAICVAIKKQSGANTLDVTRRFYKKLETLRKQMPAGVDLSIFYDQSVPVLKSVDDVKFTLALAIVLVVLVVLAFLRSVLGMLIAAVAIPLSMLATFMAMLKLGFTLDMLSLMSLTLAIGFVVDDAIVMLENIVRHLHMGKTPMQAAREAADEIGFTIISMTLSLVVVFVPILFMGGVIGRILHEFSMTISAMVLISGLVTLTFTPMLCSRLLRKKSSLADEGIIFNRLQRFYKWSLEYAVRYKWVTLLVGVAMLAGSALSLNHIPKGFEPQGDLGFLQAFCVGRQGVSGERIAKQTMELLPIIQKTHGVQNVIIVTGYPSQNNSFIGVQLKPYGEGRDVNASVIAQQLQAKLNQTPGLWTFVSNPPLIPMGGKQTNSTYQYTLQSMDMNALVKYSQLLTQKLQGLKELSGVNSNLTANSPQINIQIDRKKASGMGLTAKNIENALLNGYAGKRVVWIYDTSNTYKVILELQPGARRYPDQLSHLYIKAESTGKLVRLDSFCSFVESTGFLTVNHTGQLPSVTISFNTAPGYSLLEATKAVNDAAKILPEDISAGFEGMASAFEASLTSLAILLASCVLIIYIILGILYEDFLHPLTIISGLPSATFGGLLILFIFGRELDLFGFVGLILLIGIVMKNAIMVVNFALQREHSGMSPHDAVCEGALIRFRPIMMTTVAASMGALPIALGIGAGAEARQPLGLIVVGGLILSQFVTLYLTPAVYIYLDNAANFFKKKRGEEIETPESLE